MSWFSVSIMMEGCRANGENLWEERIVMISADSSEDARDEASRIGTKNEVSFENSDGMRISWIFSEVCSVFEIGERPSSGTEVFSRYLRASEAQSLLKPFDES